MTTALGKCPCRFHLSPLLPVESGSVKNPQSQLSRAVKKPTTSKVSAPSCRGGDAAPF